MISVTSKEFKSIAEQAFKDSGRFEPDKYGFMDGFTAAFLLASQGQFNDQKESEINVDKIHGKN
jgi:hypothetical protein